MKPIVGVIAAPAMILGGTGGVPFGCCCDDGRGVVAFFVVSSAIGAVAGLATGIVSDVRVLTGHASDPTANWFDPFAVNH
ncbi:MAG: hypothetical protein KDE27_25175 [Planctomycetes bacterium]|nr:hypothetical protein [Planctomycetota bacterium]